ncbi:QacE family quaternary ammonium compound efflux SMR transporter [Domibacillus antri]|uniref:QacE family quaternary ammonium compound efflux SMR transporter n=1 Tax=Domibacillus antri TaxID=1714264 RepID=A0A1Q8Q8F5_9BACI|nr:multidrug efflux SMR transporter [Domibacillus antri]OLN23581.1 QacE family quaternary ammonium compound efflux SMR transporter [Domibacillus antri]
MMWALLIIAGLFEVVGVTGMSMVNTRKHVLSWIVLVGGFSLSFLCLSIAMTAIPMGTSYGVWTGIGTVGSAVVGMMIYGEPRDAKRLLFIAMIIVSVVGLKMVS